MYISLAVIYLSLPKRPVQSQAGRESLTLPTGVTRRVHPNDCADYRMSESTRLLTASLMTFQVSGISLSYSSLNALLPGLGEPNVYTCIDQCEHQTMCRCKGVGVGTCV